MSGTGLAYTATPLRRPPPCLVYGGIRTCYPCAVLSWSMVRLLATQGPVLSWRMVVSEEGEAAAGELEGVQGPPYVLCDVRLGCYAMPSTDLACGAIFLHACYSKSGTDIPCLLLGTRPARTCRSIVTTARCSEYASMNEQIYVQE
eukprot:3033159-Rhodomonas_salina.10